jgi:hypothetical protein
MVNPFPAPRVICLAIITTLSATSGTTPARAQERMQPGQWEFESQFKSGASGAMSSVDARCIDEDSARGARGSADDIREAIKAQAPGCKIEEVTAEAERVTFRQTCDSLLQTAEFYYRSTTMEGKVTMTSPGAPPMILTSHGKRVGPCP